MLTRNQFKQIGIHERLIRGKGGRLFRVRFEVAEIKGEICGRVIFAEPVGELDGITNHDSRIKIFLGGITEKNPAPRSRIFASKILSPFSSLEFLVSQPTRAPSLK